MSKLFSVLAGVSEHQFAIGKVDFFAAPLTITEYAIYTAIPEESLDEQLAFWADKLKRRIVKPTTHSPDLITPEWLMDNLPMAKLRVLQHVLLHGEMPTPGADEGKS